MRARADALHANEVPPRPPRSSDFAPLGLDGPDLRPPRSSQLGCPMILLACASFLVFCTRPSVLERSAKVIEQQQLIAGVDEIMIGAGGNDDGMVLLYRPARSVDLDHASPSAIRKKWSCTSSPISLIAIRIRCMWSCRCRGAADPFVDRPVQAAPDGSEAVRPERAGLGGGRNRAKRRATTRPARSVQRTRP